MSDDARDQLVDLFREAVWRALEGAVRRGLMLTYDLGSLSDQEAWRVRAIVAAAAAAVWPKALPPPAPDHFDVWLDVPGNTLRVRPSVLAGDLLNRTWLAAFGGQATETVVQ